MVVRTATVKPTTKSPADEIFGRPRNSDDLASQGATGGFRAVDIIASRDVSATRPLTVPPGQGGCMAEASLILVLTEVWRRRPRRPPPGHRPDWFAGLLHYIEKVTYDYMCFICYRRDQSIE